MLSENKIIYKEGDKFGDGKYGVMDFDGEIVIPAKYSHIYNYDNYLIVKIGGESYKDDEGLQGLITNEGKTIIPIKYNRLSKRDDIIIGKNNEGSTLYKIIYSNNDK